ncbi:DNA-deoxyinosine glycosylase [Altererythrobacter sp. B11]|uniref:DNA-deoxyinosine glycosylase n=1 Tax=Altererythrobacter sp. B11 TaxID=2060312 RepID=UPI000DC6D350|nr:DNA-deoxyinosine glycosylase [Altererythrobacter sp. B11]BBC74069.1 DNA-deoxyinosine glycosylase [Altererythrobacter sp. B11]
MPQSPRKSAFAPVVAADTRVLLLGSLPGESSLAQGRYYAHPQNRFWHLVGRVIGADLPAMDYDDRLAALRAARIGLWDTVASATRSGSLDASMRDIVPRPLAELTATLPELRAVGFNGRKAQDIGMKQLAGSGLALIPLPSSSPAHAGMTLATKEKLWAEIGKYLV